MSVHQDRWYGSLGSRNRGPLGKVQIESPLRDAARGRTGHGEPVGGFTLPEPILRLAQAEYERQYGRQQDYERMQERGGLGLMEVVALLADYVERLGGKPTEPRVTPQ